MDIDTDKIDAVLALASIYFFTGGHSLLLSGRQICGAGMSRIRR